MLTVKRIMAVKTKQWQPMATPRQPILMKFPYVHDGYFEYYYRYEEQTMAIRQEVSVVSGNFQSLERHNLAREQNIGKNS